LAAAFSLLSLDIDTDEKVEERVEHDIKYIEKLRISEKWSM
jgi:hypothetical protein